MNNLPKLIKLFCLLFVSALPVSAQHYTDTVSTFYELKAINDAYFDSIRAARELQGIYDMKGTGYGKYIRWLEYWKDFMPATGNQSDAATARTALLFHQMAEQESFNNSNPNNLTANPVIWEEVGPFNYSKVKMYYNSDWINPHENGIQVSFFGGVGLFDRIYRHPTNNQMLFTSNSEGGGLFYSEDNGETWQNGGTDRIPFPKITAIAAKPNSNNVWAIGLKNGAVYLTINKGQNWKLINASDTVLSNLNITNSSLTQTGSIWMRNPVTNLEPATESAFDIQFSPDGNTLYVAGFNGLYYSNNYPQAGRTWQKYAINPPFTINPGAPDYTFLNFSAFFKHQKNNIEYWFTAAWADSKENETFVNGIQADSVGNRWYAFYVSSNNGITWQYLPLPTSIMEGYYRLKDVTRTAEVKIDAVPESSKIYFAMPVAENNIMKVLVYDLDANSWELMTHVDDPNELPHWIPYSFAVNQAENSGTESWFFNNDYYRFNLPSTSPSQSFYPSYSSKFHADVRAVLSETNGTWWLATDGGIYKSTDNLTTFQPKSEGLNATEPSPFLGISQKKPYLVGTGYWHCGIQMLNPDDSENWHNWPIGDGNYGLFDFNNPNYFMSFDQGNSPSYIDQGYYQSTYPVSFDGGNVYSAAGSELTEKLIYTKHSLIKRSENFGSGGNYTLPVDGTPSWLVTANKRAGRIYLAPSDDNVLYIQDFSTTPNSDRIVKLTDAKTTGNTYTEIDVTGLGNFLWGTAMCIDERNPDRFWIAAEHTIRNQNDPNYGEKIWLYENGNFINITYSIENYPDFPWYIQVNSIVRDRETGILYIGTSNGVYYFDVNILKWRKYSANIPFDRTSLHINYCEGYLYASSNRRGIWKAPLIKEPDNNNPLVVDNNPIEITGVNTIWNSRQNIFRDVVVKAGAKLTITADVYVYGQQKIIVEPGAILQINGGRITDGCGYPWQGIQLWGNAAQAQTQGPGGFYPQARLIMGNAILENAENAVTTWKPEDWTKTGGLIQASNSTFRNNRRSVELRYYNHPDKSRFTSCTFVTDGPVAGGNLHTQHMVTAENISGTRFTGCVFECTDMNLPLLPVGIYTHNARFEVVPGTTSQVYPPPPASLVPTRFKGLRAGIEALNGSTRNFTVDTALFENCYYGVIASNVKQHEVLRSNFSLKAQGVFGYRAIGIYNTGSTGYKIENNRFINPDTDPQDYRIYGIYTDNSGAASNRIYNNLYSGMQVANLSTRTNWSPFTKQGLVGLQYRCNVQDLGKRDILIANGNIGKNQGTVIIDINTGLPIYNPAANTFSAVPLPAGHIGNYGTEPIQYVHHNQNSSSFLVKPINISNNVTTISGTDGLTNRAAYCPSLLPAPVWLRRQLAETGFDAEKPAFDDIHYTYNNLLNGGNTQQMINTVVYSWPQQVWELRENLLQQSPFLGMEVLYEVADNTDVLPHAVQLEVFMANPHCVRDARFMEYLALKNLPMPGWMINLLAGQANTRTLKDELENGMAYHAANWEYHADEMLKTLYADTLNHTPDSLLLWFAKKNDPVSYSHIYAGLLDYTSAHGMADSMLTDFVYEKYMGEELLALKELCTLLHGFELSGYSYWRLAESEQQQLAAYAETGSTYAHRYARNLAAFYYGYEFADELPDFNAPKKAGINGYAHTAVNDGQVLKVYPNPSQGNFIFEYHYPNFHTDLYLEINNIEGVTVDRIKLYGAKGVFVWNGENKTPGTYFYKIVSGQNRLSSGTITLIK